jgi:hypothetical protein
VNATNHNANANSNTNSNTNTIDRRDGIIAVVLAGAMLVVVAITSQTLGFTRDEGYYFKAGELYANWFRLLGTSPLTALSSTGINEHLGYNPEHPFVMKGLFALSRALQTALGVDVGGASAMRFPAWVVSGVGAAAVFLLARQLRLSRATALLATTMYLTMPRVFWHQHLACFDAPVATAHVVLVLCWLRFRRTLWGAVVVGVAFGIAGGVKHNALPIPALLVVHWLFEQWMQPAPSSSSSSSSSSSLRVPVVFVSLAVVGPLAYVLCWPWLWPDVVGRFGAYLGFHLRHEHYPILYFGELLTAPPFPWTFPLVMWGVTLPLPVLVTGTMGVGAAVVEVLRAAADRLRRRASSSWTTVPLGDHTASSAVLLLVNIALPVFLIALPSSPIFGGTKHWMNALPFVCILAAWIVAEGAARVTTTTRAATLVVVGVGSLVVLPGIVRTAQSWPYGLSSYNELIGGVRGAANIGMQRTFWGYETRAVLPLINERTPKNARIHFGDVNADSHRRYIEDGLLRRDIAFSNTVRGAGVAHVEPQGEFKQQQLDVFNEWQRAPDAVVDVDGVPLSTVTFRR